MQMYFQDGHCFCITLCMPVLLILVLAERSGSTRAGNVDLGKENANLVPDDSISHHPSTNSHTASNRQKRFSGKENENVEPFG